ncbi:MAG: NAD-dependent epimerase/dehydratase family protein [Gemmatimonadaceae bacterium]|nr:NAD-dependent epimerase/dehydratase family protein [Gemmatimonadaceae bacterium]
MRVIITGGAGFVGSHLADRLLARGDEVLVIDTFATGRRDNLTPQPGLTVVEGSIADRDVVDETFVDFAPQVVVHAAAAYKNPDDWAEDCATNALGSALVAQASARVAASRLIYFQTALCYGLKPIEQPITLSHPLVPYGSSYAISKTAGEGYVALSGVPFLSFRLANAYGPRNMSGPLPTFFQRLDAGKKCFVMNTRRDFVFVDDLIDVIEKAVHGMGSGGFYHVSSGRDYSIKELFDATVAAMGIALDAPVEERERNPDDVFSILLDPSRTQREFSWTTGTPLSDGVARAIAYYREYGIEETFTHLRLAAT